MMSAKVSRLAQQRRVQVLEGRDQLAHRLLAGGDVHGGREGVVRGLAAVDVVVGVHGRLAAALPAQQLVGPVGDDLVGVHVGLGAGAGLPDDERELVVAARPSTTSWAAVPMASAEPRLELAQLLVDPCRRELDDAQGADRAVRGMRSPPMRKFCSERWVWAPQ